MSTILHARVSTAEQTIDHQLARARAAGFTIDEVVADNGVSGLSTRLTERPEGRRLHDKLRAGDTLVVRGSTVSAETTKTCATPSASLCGRRGPSPFPRPFPRHRRRRGSHDDQIGR
jgi:hypothetical protein